MPMLTYAEHQKKKGKERGFLWHIGGSIKRRDMIIKTFGVLYMPSIIIFIYIDEMMRYKTFFFFWKRICGIMVLCMCMYGME